MSELTQAAAEASTLVVEEAAGDHGGFIVLDGGVAGDARPDDVKISQVAPSAPHRRCEPTSSIRGPAAIHD